MKLTGLVCLILCALLIVLVGFQPDAWAQSGTTGALTGSVGNSTGDPLPAATVTLRNEATGQAQTAVTDTNGAFAFPALAPGSYVLNFSGAGFKNAQASDVVVNVSENAVVDARLEAGPANDPAPCLCTVAHTTSSSTGTLVDSKTITAVPLTGRNFTQVLSNAAGAAGDVNNAGLLGNRNQAVNVNGNTAGSNFALDGTSTGSVPNPDTISQFRIQTSQYDSGFGARVPTTNLITRSGSNDFHGALWEFVRNDVFNANAFFQNANGRPKPNLKQNQFGGTIGGPIKKDKLFVFFSYQGTRQINGLDPTSLSTLVLPPLTDNRSAAAIGSQFCPQNHPRNDGAVNAASNPFYSFAGGTAGSGLQVACDGSNINPIALTILQMKLADGSYLLPTPQHINAVQTSDSDPTKRYVYNLGGSSYSIPSSWDDGHYLFNTDYVISKKQTLLWRFFYSHTNQFRSFGSPGGAMPGGPQLTAGVPQITHFVNLATSLKLTSVLTSNLVNEVRMSFSRGSMLAWGLGNPTATAVGMIPADPFFDQPPEITVQGSLGVFRFFGAGSNDFHNRDHTFQWADNLSWVHGRHTIRTGFYLDRVSEARLDLGAARGKMTFQNFTDFLLGRSAAQNGSPSGLSNVDSINANEGAGAQGEVQTLRLTTTASAFLQDDIKLKPRFTVNFGLRWEYLAPTFDELGQMGNTWPSLLALARIPPVSGTYQGYALAANYDPNTINPYTGQPFGPPPAGVIIRDQKSLYENNAPLHAFAPRFGFAWQPGSKQGRISVRGGYGWFYQNAGVPSFNAPPFVQGFTNNSASNNLSTLQKPFPTPTLGFQLRTPASQLSDRIAGPVYELALLQQWNLTTQLTLVRNLTLDIGYVGSFGTHLGNGQGLNQPLLASPGHPVNCGLPNTPAGLGVSPSDFAKLGVDAAGCVTINTAKNAYLRVPYVGETPSALLANEFSGGSRYNGLQTTLRKQLSRGLSFQVSYTYSRTMNNVGNWFNDQTNGRLDWSRTNFDRTQRLTFNYSYEFPNLASPGGFRGALLRGWSMSGVTSIQSGTPITLSDRSGGSIYGRAANSTITVCPGMTYADLVTPGRAQDRLGGGYSANGWVNLAAVCPAAPLGDETTGQRATGYGTAGQNLIIGPGQNDWDLSIGKAQTVGGLREDAQLQLRAEFYNTFNHPQFTNPGTVFGTSTFGVITQTSVGPRLIQFGIKYLF